MLRFGRCVFALIKSRSWVWKVQSVNLVIQIVRRVYVVTLIDVPGILRKGQGGVMVYNDLFGCICPTFFFNTIFSNHGIHQELHHQLRNFWLLLFSEHLFKRNQWKNRITQAQHSVDASKVAAILVSGNLRLAWAMRTLGALDAVRSGNFHFTVIGGSTCYFFAVCSWPTVICFMWIEVYPSDQSNVLIMMIMICSFEFEVVPD